ncbi:hypothetical protein BDP27DRAFT_1419741 [Rhodocollybia butyracea]|uniref:Uncharacterized protein n=1 Tax=Rhodocollybia butyracea TaxID=206335 RepID=A0A9P5U996_9AGAR|nr:hypothetical protein BDP27DRAFT_1419741 [Rhodocollybia butyracea]
MEPSQSKTFFAIQNYKHDHMEPLECTVNSLPDNFILQNAGPIKRKKRKQAPAMFSIKGYPNSVQPVMQQPFSNAPLTPILGLALDQPFIPLVDTETSNDIFATNSDDWSPAPAFFKTSFSSTLKTPSRQSIPSPGLDLSFGQLSIPKTPLLGS